MFNISKTRAKVWKVEESKGFVTINITVSEKTDKGYENSNYYGCNCYGEAKEFAKTLKSGDIINIISGKIGKVKGKDSKYYDNLKFFKIELYKPNTKDVSTEEASVYDDMDIDYNEEVPPLF